jgi:hypothetical protein
VTQSGSYAYDDIRQRPCGEVVDRPETGASSCQVRIQFGFRFDRTQAENKTVGFAGLTRLSGHVFKGATESDRRSSEMPLVGVVAQWPHRVSILADKQR